MRLPSLRFAMLFALTEVRELLDVGLPQPRDQVATKELPEFARLRAHVWRTIKRPDEADVAWAG